MSPRPLIELQGITRSFGEGELAVPVLKGIDLKIWPGEFVAIMGPSGSGKSTLMNILGCLDQPSAGQYRFNGRDVSALNRDELALLRRDAFGFVFQSYNLLPVRMWRSPPFTPEWRRPSGTQGQNGYSPGLGWASVCRTGRHSYRVVSNSECLLLGP